MKRFLVLMMVLMALAWSAPSEAAFQDYWADVYRWSGGYNADGSPTVTKATTGITYRVMSVDSNVKETLYAYADNTLTSKTNGITTTVFATDGGKIAFRTDPTDTTNDRYVNLVVIDTAGGYSTTVKNFDKYTHAVVIDERPNQVHQGVIFYDHATTASVNTGIYLSKHTFITAMLPEHLVATGGGAISIGISGSSSAFRYGSTAAIGYSSLAANVPNLQIVAGLQSNNYFTTATTSIYTTAQSAAGAAYYGQVHYWFTVIQ